MRRVVVIGGLTARLEGAIVAAGLAQQGKVEWTAAWEEQAKGSAERRSLAEAAETPSIAMGAEEFLRADNNTRRYTKIKPRIAKNSKAHKPAYKYHK